MAFSVAKIVHVYFLQNHKRVVVLLSVQHCRSVSSLSDRPDLKYRGSQVEGGVKGGVEDGVEGGVERWGKGVEGGGVGLNL